MPVARPATLGSSRHELRHLLAGNLKHFRPLLVLVVRGILARDGFADQTRSLSGVLDVFVPPHFLLLLFSSVQANTEIFSLEYFQDAAGRCD